MNQRQGSVPREQIIQRNELRNSRISSGARRLIASDHNGHEMRNSAHGHRYPDNRQKNDECPYHSPETCSRDHNYLLRRITRFISVQPSLRRIVWPTLRALFNGWAFVLGS
jgi:hypothetical protein